MWNREKKILQYYLIMQGHRSYDVYITKYRNKNAEKEIKQIVLCCFKHDPQDTNNKILKIFSENWNIHAKYVSSPTTNRPC